MARVTIQGKEMQIAKIFGGDFVFSVPNYQRPYAWTTEESGELFNDLLVAMENGDNPVEELNPYFIGSIVLIKGEKPDSQIVDGQQRLVTLIILLSAIRSMVGNKEADAITKLIYEKEDLILGTPDRYRLAIRDRDKEFFREYIQKEGKIHSLRNLNEELPDSQKNLKQNAVLFQSNLERLDEEKRVLLARFIARNCYLVVVSTPDLNSAYRIFSVLNDRGLDLSYADILKAEIIGKIPQKDEMKYSQKWEDMEDNLGRDTFGDLFAHIRMIHAKSKLRGTILQEFRQYVKPEENPKNFIDKVLLPMGESFDQIQNASYESPNLADQINKYLLYLKRIDNFDWQPPAIAFFVRNKTDPQEIFRFTKGVERLAAGMMIMRADINYRIERYSRLLSVIEKGKDVFVDDSPLQLTLDEKKNITKALNGDIYKVVKIRLPVLLRLDEALSEGEATYDYPIVTVEHVFPQTPMDGSEWLRWWPDDNEQERNIHRLGNLVLLSRRKNSQAQNYEFERKKKEYFQRRGVSPFALTTQVLQEKEWTPHVVETRQELLIRELTKVWDL